MSLYVYLIVYMYIGARKSLKDILYILLVCVTCRYDAERAEKGESLTLENIQETLGIPLLGVIPESKDVLASSNLGQPVISLPVDAGEAYKDCVRRFLGEENVSLRFTTPNKSFFQKLFGR